MQFDYYSIYLLK